MHIKRSRNNTERWLGGGLNPVAVESTVDCDSLVRSANVFSESNQPNRTKENPGLIGIQLSRDRKIPKHYDDFLVKEV